MLIEAARDHDIDLKASFMVGDKDADMLAGRNAGATTVFVRTGQQESSGYADITADNLKDALERILGIK